MTKSSDENLRNPSTEVPTASTEASGQAGAGQVAVSRPVPVTSRRSALRKLANFALPLLAFILILPIALGIRRFSWWFPIALGATTLVLLIIFVLWGVPKWQVRSFAHRKSKERFDSENEARKTLSQIVAGLAQIVGGLVLLIGVYFAWQNLKLARDSQTDAQKAQTEAQKAAQASLELALKGQITDRFSKAIAQLGDNKLELRLGGIYALEGIAKESTEYHWPIMEVLTAYVREHAKPNTRKKVPRGRARSPVLAEDIQAALTVIGRRTPEKEGSLLELDLRNAYLVRAELFEANLSGAVLDGANLDEADLIGADLSRGYLEDAQLHRALLSRANLSRANLKGAKLRMAELSDANLSEADLTGADLTEAGLYKTRLSGANLSGATLYHANLHEADLSKADLSKVDLSKVFLLVPNQLDSTIGNAQTKLPDGMLRPESWQ